MYFIILLMKTKNNNGPRINPCGTPAFIKFQSDVVPGGTTRCFQSLRLSVNHCNRVPMIPLDFSLYSKHLCQTL